jgi:hypothetical protein
VQILCTLRNVKSFLGVYPSDLLPHSITQSGTIIINADSQTEKGSHWLAIHFEPKASTAYYIDSYGISPLFPAIHPFLRLLHLLGLQHGTTARTDQHCLWPLLLPIRPVHGQRVHPKTIRRTFQLTWLTGKLKKLFSSEFGRLRKKPRGGQCSQSINKKLSTNGYFVICNTYVNRDRSSHRLRVSDRGEK